MALKNCVHKSKKEKCLLRNKFPVTKNGRFSKKRLHSAFSYGSKYGYMKKLKRAGICRIAKRHRVKSSMC